MESILTKNQKKTVELKKGKERHILNLRYDDACGNGHNTFAITMDTYKGKILESCGCQHDEIRKLFPGYAKYIKWHLCSTDGPVHYVANSVYHAKQNNLDYARSSAIWPEASIDDFTEIKLKARLGKLLDDFAEAMVDLNFTY